MPALLLDVVMLVDICRDVVRALSSPFKSLLITGWLFLIVLYVFASVGMYLFGEQYSSSDDDGAVNPCPDVLRCFVNGVVTGITHPEEQSMDTAKYTMGWGYYGRVLYDLLFFIVVGVFLFDMVTTLLCGTCISLRARPHLTHPTAHIYCTSPIVLPCVQ